jgi:hypothetical protein
MSRSHGLTALWAAAGVLVAWLVSTALADWAVAKFGYFEPDYIGVTVAVPAGLILVCLALVGTRLPGTVGTLAALAVVAGSLVVLGTIATNLPSAADGIAARAVPLALTLASSAIWVLMACWIAIRR